MAPMEPSPRKRMSPDSDSGSNLDEPPSKRVRIEPTLPKTPPPEEISSDGAQKVLFPDDLPHELLRHSVGLVLNHVGFDSASPEALEALCSQAETYAAHFISKVTMSMLNARRSFTNPLDYQYALAEFDLPIASLEPHLRPPIAADKLLIQLEPLPAEEEPTSTPRIDLLLGGDLSGEPDKLARPYVPKKFPSFPSKHTYKWTETESARETDPRKIREEAAKAARHGEEALRRLMKVAKAGKEKDVKIAASKDPKSKERHKLWEQTMEDLVSGQAYLGKIGQHAGEEDDRGLIVNADRLFYRKGAPVRRKQPFEVRPTIEIG
ncbi:uncharacterized protein LY89DRAFT_717752 [Mollisia scopiformis]|uniref:Transcription initiation factor TFIID subunit 8 n=1 Tax=Mollisia scopiformis TaxID=149040 RepID=A0A194XEG3_MOLSC|nr:uncharacterized protein LY89DRAFT_717752 [Mollisia scopiformis]KUJ18147.1 hypothetical protein LY89DRAFT_717752 [Mollisia scopiformis]